MAESYQQLRNLSVDDLIKKHDRVAGSWDPSASHYLSEIARRDQDRQTKAMVKYTCWITVMTIIMTVATILNLLKSS